ncbi:4'-phosphopantetheinyl transferase family protein [Larsenimonas rhizosphaerae]|uniref:4'-phosphopantetheinyl transferase family protein n=1 Tax=Larsenimonas rhizosphaerae TaxID=2944682 RepID=UPI0020333B7D|nr:4'-phosphopantetheinyl transferase superfamily protein [Larsenimonas rhizosphaerae]MCM2130206.1 4'-phosphopantetheinyl transferase superfamily protein [Larsenimonas rhizosphaerae]
MHLPDALLSLPEPSLLPSALADQGIWVTCRFDPSRLEATSFDDAGITLPERLKRAAPKRQTEYLAGRCCVREALRALGHSPATPFRLDNAEDRRPLWPQGVVGTLTHSPDLAGAWLAPADQWQALGMDAEHIIPAPRAARLQSAILTASEQTLLAGLDAEAFAHALTLVFSVKESLYKALYPLTGTPFYFMDARLVSQDAKARTLTLELLKPLSRQWPAGRRLICHWQPCHHQIITFAAIPAGQ